MVDDPYLTATAAAELAGCHRETLLKALREGELKGYQRKEGISNWRVQQSAVTRWVRGETLAVAA